jgi:AraC family L-rhamnose operon regulatory protein RhaS
MNPQTIDRRYNVGKIIPIQCVEDNTLKDLEIKNTCFLLIIIHCGTLCFKVGNTTFEATGPCFVCFDETEAPKLVRKRGVKCDSIYFDPTFLNVNMIFSRIHSEGYEQLALAHDLFLLKPFTDKIRYVYPIFDEFADNPKRLFTMLKNELQEQRDWYFSCRSRSYFMEIILLLERSSDLGIQSYPTDSSNQISNPQLKKAVIYIENNYHNNISLESLVRSASINHSTLTQLFKNEFNMTPIEYLWNHRLVVAKKFLEFTELPIKDIALRCGFKTTQHFSRKFEESFGDSPSNFRSVAVAKRKQTF